MEYKVVLVEDEIATREGIRDNVDWKSARCKLHGEAPDGEMALPLIETIKPDIVITDIKMPFMDGLQLSKIIRKRFPWIKIIILSGYDEFEYAQTALNIGVSEFLLKPISSENMNDVLKKTTELLNKETENRILYENLLDEAEDNIANRRESFLLRLAMSAVPYTEAIEQIEKLGLDIVASYYLTLLLKIEFLNNPVSFNYHIFQSVEQRIITIAGNYTDVFYTKRDLEDFVLILTGDDANNLQQTAASLANQIQQEVESSENCKLAVKVGTLQQRLGDLHLSIAGFLVEEKKANKDSLLIDSFKKADQAHLLILERAELQNYLKFGNLDDYDAFIASYLQSVDETIKQKGAVRNYLIIDIILMITQFLRDLGVHGDSEFDLITDLEQLLQTGADLDRTKEVLKTTITGVLLIRDSRMNNERSKLVNQAKTYIDQYFCDPDLKMSHVAAKYNLSSGYFSALFSQEFGESFRNYLNSLRINNAKVLLRTTNLKCSEIACQSGYNDPHYFSTIFKNHTGYTPQQFRSQPQDGKN